MDRFEVLPFDVVCAEYHGTLAALVRQHGRKPRPRRPDLQIAATAACHGVPLFTRNGGDVRADGDRRQSTPALWSCDTPLAATTTP